MGKTQFLTQVQRRHKDKRTGHYTTITWMVPRPRVFADMPCILLSISTGPRRKVMLRFRDVGEALQCFALDSDQATRLTTQLAEAHAQAAEIVERDRLDFLRRDGVGLIRMDTGEVIHQPRTDTREVVAEAERIVADHGAGG